MVPRVAQVRALFLGANLGHSSLRVGKNSLSMPHGLKRFQQSAQSHFVTFTCYHRRRGFDSPAVYDLFIQVLEEMRRRFAVRVYGYVVMPEHVHLLLNEAQQGDATFLIPEPALSEAEGLAPKIRARTWATSADT
jgi:hypothetical protein